MGMNASLFRIKLYSIVLGIIAAAGILFEETSAQPVLFSNFNDGKVDATETFFSKLSSAVEANGQLTLRATFPDPTRGDLNNSLGGLLWPRDLPLQDSQTLELKVNLVDVSGDEAIVSLTYFSANENGLYAVLFDSDRLYLDKLSFSAGAARFLDEPAPAKRSNISIAFILSGVGDGVLLTIRITDNDNHGSLLFERSFFDSASIDPTLRTPGFTNQINDPGPALRRATHSQLLLMQNTDGNGPEVWATFDDFTSEYTGPLILNLRRAVQISWPAYETDFAVEGAKTLEGPWQRISGSEATEDGIHILTIPAPESNVFEIFRLVEP